MIGADFSGDRVADEPLATRASDIIANELRRLILKGEVVSGGFLQPTNVLLERFNVSRATLREAFRLLENERLVSVSRGSRRGVKVLGPSTTAAVRVGGQSLQATGATIGDLYQALLGFEPLAARLVAERHDRRDIAALRAHLTLLDRTARTTPAEHGVELVRFHHLLVELTGNRVLTLMFDMISTALEQHQKNESRARAEVTQDPIERARFSSVGLNSIRKLIRFIEAGDAEGAEAHWRIHVTKSNEYWLKGQDRYALVNVTS